MSLRLLLCSVTYCNASLAEVTTVILCRWLPTLPKFIQLLHKSKKPRRLSRQHLWGKESSKQKWSMRTNLATPPSIRRTRTVQGDPNDPDLYLNDSYVPLVDQCSIKPWVINKSRETVDLEKNDRIRNKQASERTLTLGLRLKWKMFGRRFIDAKLALGRWAWFW